jgi:hypothetical protein
MLSVHLRVGLQCGLLPSGFVTKNPYALVFSPIRALWPAYHISLVFITQSYFVNGTNRTHCTWRGWAPGPVRIVTEKSLTTGPYSRAVNPVASSCTDWATPAAIFKGKEFQNYSYRICDCKKTIAWWKRQQSHDSHKPPIVISSNIHSCISKFAKGFVQFSSVWF